MAKAHFGMPKDTKGYTPAKVCPKCGQTMGLVKRVRMSWKDAKGNKVKSPGGIWWSCKNDKCDYEEKK